MIEKEILSDTDSIYNYMDGDKVLGYLEIRLVDGVLDIMNLFVNEEDRRKGIATELMNKMIQEENYSRIMLEVNENNDSAIRLYNKLIENCNKYKHVIFIGKVINKSETGQFIINLISDKTGWQKNKIIRKNTL